MSISELIMVPGDLNLSGHQGLGCMAPTQSRRKLCSTTRGIIVVLHSSLSLRTLLSLFVMCFLVNSY